MRSWKTILYIFWKTLQRFAVFSRIMLHSDNDISIFRERGNIGASTGTYEAPHASRICASCRASPLAQMPATEVCVRHFVGRVRLEVWRSSKYAPSHSNGKNPTAIPGHTTNNSTFNGSLKICSFTYQNVERPSHTPAPNMTKRHQPSQNVLSQKSTKALYEENKQLGKKGSNNRFRKRYNRVLSSRYTPIHIALSEESKIPQIPRVTISIYLTCTTGPVRSAHRNHAYRTIPILFPDVISPNFHFLHICAASSFA